MAKKDEEAVNFENLPEEEETQELLTSQELQRIDNDKLSSRKVLTDGILDNFENVDDVIRWMTEQGFEIPGYEEFAGAYPVLKESKDTLIGTPMMLLKWEFYEGTWGKFVSIHVLAEGNRRFILNDGSTGICNQLTAVTEKQRKFVEQGRKILTQAMLPIPQGLRRSDYTYTDASGKEIPATTFYLDM